MLEEYCQMPRKRLTLRQLSHFLPRKTAISPVIYKELPHKAYICQHELRFGREWSDEDIRIRRKELTILADELPANVLAKVAIYALRAGISAVACVFFSRFGPKSAWKEYADIIEESGYIPEWRFREWLHDIGDLPPEWLYKSATIRRLRKNGLENVLIEHTIIYGDARQIRYLYTKIPDRRLLRAAAEFHSETIDICRQFAEFSLEMNAQILAGAPDVAKHRMYVYYGRQSAQYCRDFYVDFARWAEGASPGIVGKAREILQDFADTARVREMNEVPVSSFIHISSEKYLAIYVQVPINRRYEMKGLHLKPRC